MTEEQHKNWVIRKKMFIITVLVSILFIASFVLVAYSLKTAHDQNAQRTIELCQQQNQSNLALRKILRLAQGAAKHSKDATPNQKKEAAKFYRRALVLAAPVNCTKLRKQ
jgi:hypothetical protein